MCVHCRMSSLSRDSHRWFYATEGVFMGTYCFDDGYYKVSGSKL